MIALTADEKKYLIEVASELSGDTEWFYHAEISAPGPDRGFEENIHRVVRWYERLRESYELFLGGLKVTEKSSFSWRLIIEQAVERYRSHYLALAATVPEFFVWAMLGEHAATRNAITSLHSGFANALDANKNALARVEALLMLQAAALTEQLGQCVALERANHGVLDMPIVPADAERYGAQVVFPSIGQIYINPRFRIDRSGRESKPADEAWWEERPARDDIDLVLAAHVMAPDATRVPLLLLGHPGSGKSLLTKVLAARLAASGYIVVRVPLRQVGANAPIINQIEQALAISTNDRVKWAPLSEQSHDRVRVVLLDGLDELLQASSSDRSGYLQDVMEFQRVEADLGQPIIAIVTSRTVVADRVDIPAGTTVMKLDFFNDDDIKEWLSVWRTANASLISSGAMRELSLDAVRRQAELARQPLLLLMLALYSADPNFPALTKDLSTTELYERLLDNFARREVAKKSPSRLSQSELDRRVNDQLDRLSVAALAMFNRGRQDITEAELGQDLIALHPSGQIGNIPASSQPAEYGQRLIAEFFFVHSAEAYLLSSTRPAGEQPARSATGKELPLRSYEFMHATFAEYLVASRLMSELADVAETVYGGRRGPREPDDNMLFALLSHQPLVVRRTILTFAIDIFARFTTTERQQVLDALGKLIKSHRCRHGSDRYSAYRPSPIDRIRELAAYSANLVTLRVALEPVETEVPLTTILPESGDVMHHWQSIVASWNAGLDADGRQAMASSLRLAGQSLVFNPSATAMNASTIIDDLQSVLFARLSGNLELARKLRFGMAICDRAYFTLHEEGDDWADVALSWLVPNVIGWDDSFFFFATPPDGMAETDVRTVAAFAMRLLRSRPLEKEVTREFLKFLLGLPRVFEFDTHALAVAVARYPELVELNPLLREPTTYGDDYPILRISGAAHKIEIGGEREANQDEFRAWFVEPIMDPGSPDAAIKTFVDRLFNYYADLTPVSALPRLQK